MPRKRIRPREHPRRLFSSRFKKKRGKTITVNKGIRHKQQSKIPIFTKPQTPKTTPFDTYQNVASSIGKASLEEAVVTAISTSTGNPLPLVIYNAYKLGKFGEKVTQKMTDSGIDEELEIIAKWATKSGGELIAKKRIEELSSKVSNSFYLAGVTDLLSEKTNLSESTIRDFIENTTRVALTEGIENLSEFVVETL